MDALSASSGWIALPLALLLGAITAFVMVALERIEAVLAPRARAGRRLVAPRVRGVARDALGPVGAHSPLAFGLARRPPPVPARP
jgi:hypothetical protein